MKIDIVSYFAVPLMLVALHGSINLGWLGEPSDQFSILCFVMLLVVTYQVGLKQYFASGRRKYFYSAFLVPLLLSGMSLGVWFYLRSY